MLGWLFIPFKRSVDISSTCSEAYKTPQAPCRNAEHVFRLGALRASVFSPRLKSHLTTLHSSEINQFIALPQSYLILPLHPEKITFFPDPLRQISSTHTNGCFAELGICVFR